MTNATGWSRRKWNADNARRANEPFADLFASVPVEVGQAERSAPSPADAPYQAFTLDTREDVAAEIFRSRYGQHPEFVFESNGLLLCGPVPLEVLR